MKHFNIKKLFVTVMVLLCCVSANAYDFEVDGIYYNIISSSKLTVKVTNGDNKYTGKVIVPSTITYNSNSLTVVAIDNKAFYGCNGLKNIEIPNSVTSIGRYAFYNCEGLTNIKIPNSVTSIGQEAFRGCTGLTNIEVPNSVTNIEHRLFQSCIRLSSIVIPNSVTGIGEYAFASCQSLTNITIPTSITSIEDGAFYGCTGLTTIEIPNNVTSVGNNAFQACKSLTNVTIGKCVKNIGNYAFSACENLANIAMGDSVTSIGANAFEYCSSLTNIKIPDKVTRIGEYAFYKCVGLVNVIVPIGVTTLERQTFADCIKITNITIPNSVKEIGFSAFENCAKIERIIIPDSVTEIGGWAFKNCSNLTNITIPNSVTYIGSESFRNCVSLTEVSIPSSMKTIEWATFAGCSKLRKITIPKSITKIESSAFHSCTSLIEIINDGSTPLNINSDTFYLIHRNATLYVPVGSKNAYTKAAGWKDITNIVENDFIVNYIVDEKPYKSFHLKYYEDISIIAEPTKKGHTFSGWSEAPKTMPAKDVTINGFFTVNSYKVTYKIDDKEVHYDSVAYDSIIVPPSTFYKEGYTLTWSNLPEHMPDSNIIVYGSYSLNKYLLTYIVDGKEYKSDSIAYGSTITLIDGPIKEGYTFSGWSQAPTTMPAYDISIEGTFNVNNYTVTYIIDGEVYETATVEYGAEIELPSVPEKEGYTFSGWKNVPETMPAKDIVIQGNYIVDTAVEEIYLDLGNIEVYNLKGLRITETEKLTRGIYIINGKKTFVK